MGKGVGKFYYFYNFPTTLTISFYHNFSKCVSKLKVKETVANDHFMSSVFIRKGIITTLVLIRAMLKSETTDLKTF